MRDVKPVQILHRIPWDQNREEINRILDKQQDMAQDVQENIMRNLGLIRLGQVGLN